MMKWTLCNYAMNCGLALTFIGTFLVTYNFAKDKVNPVVETNTNLEIIQQGGGGRGGSGSSQGGGGQGRGGSGSSQGGGVQSGGGQSGSRGGGGSSAPQGGGSRGSSQGGGNSGSHGGSSAPHTGGVRGGNVSPPKSTNPGGGAHAPVNNWSHSGSTRGHTNPGNPPSTNRPSVSNHGNQIGNQNLHNTHNNLPANKPKNALLQPKDPRPTNNSQQYGTIDHRNQGVLGGVNHPEQHNNNNHSITGSQRMHNNHSAIVNRPYQGNSVNYNNRQFNLGNQNYQPSYYRHAGYHGYWNGNRGYGNSGNRNNLVLGIGINSGYGGWGFGNGHGYGNGYGGYGYRPLGWGVGGWGLGSINYNSGYLNYSNPYYSSGVVSCYDYAQPIPVNYYSISQSDVGTTYTETEDVIFNNAVAAFKQNNYDSALDIINKGITQTPDDSVLHEFRALILFAKQDYQQAAATIHSVLAVGPGWDWTTLSSMYVSVSIYTDQLRALETSVRDNPQDAASKFLLAYHYMSCGHNDAAAVRLREVITLIPSDSVASEVLRMIAPVSAKEPAGLDSIVLTTPPPADQTSENEQAIQIDLATLVGNWKAARDDKSKFSLTMTEDAKFTWNFSPVNQQVVEFSGKYTIEGDVLALERTDGGSLIASIKPDGATRFNFKLIGAPENDPGLTFTR